MYVSHQAVTFCGKLYSVNPARLGQMLSKRNGAMKHQGLSALVTFVGIWPDVTSHLRKSGGLGGPFRALENSMRQIMTQLTRHSRVSHKHVSHQAVTFCGKLYSVNPARLGQMLSKRNGAMKHQGLSALVTFVGIWPDVTSQINWPKSPVVHWVVVGGKTQKETKHKHNNKGRGVCVCKKESAEATIVKRKSKLKKEGHVRGCGKVASGMAEQSLSMVYFQDHCL